MSNLIANAVQATAPLVAEKLIQKGEKLLKGKKVKPKKKNAKPKQRPKPRSQPKPKVSNPIIGVRPRMARIQPYFRRRGGSSTGTDSTIFEGLDFVASIATLTSAFDPVMILPLNPLAIPNTRLGVEASLWTKFMYLMFEVIFVPTLGSSNNGALLFAHVNDPELDFGNYGTSAVMNALTASCKPTMLQIWEPGHHKWLPASTEKKEFYIQPDIQDESRLTVQGSVICIQLTADQYNTAGLVYVKYAVKLYNPILAVSAINTTRSLPCIGGGSPTGQTVGIVDNGVTGVTQVTFAAAQTTLSINTVYACWFNFTGGYIQAMQVLYFKTGATINTATALYTDLYDATAQNSASKLSGTIWGTPVPTTALMYYTAAASLPPSRVTHSDTDEEIADILTRLEALESSREDDTDLRTFKTHLATLPKKSKV